MNGERPPELNGPSVDVRIGAIVRLLARRAARLDYESLVRQFEAVTGRRKDKEN